MCVRACPLLVFLPFSSFIYLFLNFGSALLVVSIISWASHICLSMTLWHVGKDLEKIALISKYIIYSINSNPRRRVRVCLDLIGTRVHLMSFLERPRWYYCYFYSIRSKNFKIFHPYFPCIFLF